MTRPTIISSRPRQPRLLLLLIASSCSTNVSRDCLSSAVAAAVTISENHCNCHHHCADNPPCPLCCGVSSPVDHQQYQSTFIHSLPSPSLTERIRYRVARIPSVTLSRSVYVSAALVSTAKVMRCIQCSLVYSCTCKMYIVLKRTRTPCNVIIMSV